MNGFVDVLRRALLPVTLRGPYGHLAVDAIIDTGFSGSLSLTPEAIRRLGLRPFGSTLVQDASGLVALADAYLVDLDWLEGPMRCEAVESRISHCLVGTQVLADRLLEIDFGPAKKVEVR
jgi:predicted aspartyl protease